MANGKDTGNCPMVCIFIGLCLYYLLVCRPAFVFIGGSFFVYPVGQLHGARLAERRGNDDNVTGQKNISLQRNDRFCFSNPKNSFGQIDKTTSSLSCHFGTQFFSSFHFVASKEDHVAQQETGLVLSPLQPITCENASEDHVV